MVPSVPRFVLNTDNVFRMLCLNPTLYRCLTGCVCDNVTVLLGDIVLEAFEKILFCFPGREKLHFYNCTNFFTTARSVHNCTLKNPDNMIDQILISS